ncbi:MAG: hypothetical protein H0T69_11990 [Thermoleophilaceae bacterium]|nr:hypothetical protein [Thermoleophilaceae bacterium]
MTVPGGFRTRCVATALIVMTAAVTITATAEGWRRPSDLAYSSPSGGHYQVCRDGISFEVALLQSLATDPPPTEPANFTVFSPPPPVDSTGMLIRDQDGNIVGGTIAAQGTFTTNLQPPPGYDAGGVFYWYYGAHKARWSDGKVFQPTPDAIYFLSAYSDEVVDAEHTDDVGDCLIFPPQPFCRSGVTIEIPEDQVQPGDVPGACPLPPPPDVRVCRDGKTIVVPEDQVRAGDVRGDCPVPPEYRCAGKRATIVGTSGADTLRGTARADVIAGRGGKDRLSGLGGNDRICGGTGNDTARGGPGNDRVYGDSGNDRLSGDSGRDVIKGGAGRDRLNGGRGPDTLVGGPGVDLGKQ